MKKTIYIRNMVCNRCIEAVAEALLENNIAYENIILGEVELVEEPAALKFKNFVKKIENKGFEIIDDKKTQLIEKIKNLLVNEIHYSRKERSESENFSDYLSRKLSSDYSYLSHLFSSIEGTTIEKYIIAQKIEKAKELLVYGELTLSEIAYELGYSSVQHLSGQFKKVTGLTPSHFKEVGNQKRIPIDKVR
jgi:AraC family transcriptional regulator